MAASMNRWGSAVVGVVALCAPVAAYLFAPPTRFAHLLQWVLATLYVVHAAALSTGDRRYASSTNIPGDAAIEAARAYLRHKTYRHGQTQWCLLAGAILLNLLIGVTKPHNNATLLWMLCVPFILYALATLRLALLQVQIERGEFWDPPQVRAISLFILKRRAASANHGGKTLRVWPRGTRVEAREIVSGLMGRSVS